jgi:hypothetical protein
MTILVLVWMSMYVQNPPFLTGGRVADKDEEARPRPQPRHAQPANPETQMPPNPRRSKKLKA